MASARSTTSSRCLSANTRSATWDGPMSPFWELISAFSVTTPWPVARSRRRACPPIRPKSFHDTPCPSFSLRLAVDQSAHGRGLGRYLLRDALTRSLDLAEKLGIHAVVVDALDAEAKTFYERLGFVPLTDNEMRMFLPMSTIRSAAKP